MSRRWAPHSPATTRHARELPARVGDRTDRQLAFPAAPRRLPWWSSAGSSPTLVVRNDDPLYVRSFDIDELDLHVFVPPRTAVRVELPPGPATYEAYDFVTLTPATSAVIEVQPGG